MQAGSLGFLTEGPEEKDLYILTEFFKMLGNPTRIHILLLLMEQDGCVSGLAEQLGMTQSAVSHQLSLLKSNKLVKPHEEQRTAAVAHPGVGELGRAKSYHVHDAGNEIY